MYLRYLVFALDGGREDIDTLYTLLIITMADNPKYRYAK
jgi:hypothetical protein